MILPIWACTRGIREIFAVHQRYKIYTTSLVRDTDCHRMPAARSIYNSYIYYANFSVYLLFNLHLHSDPLFVILFKGTVSKEKECNIGSDEKNK
ncbi:hypothetical protein CN345_18330 [Bacillus thuringiensis]|nr:hypothetical protein CN345_18330 [Bacillus thuringiensis]